MLVALPRNMEVNHDQLSLNDVYTAADMEAFNAIRVTRQRSIHSATINTFHEENTKLFDRRKTEPAIKSTHISKHERNVRRQQGDIFSMDNARMPSRARTTTPESDKDAQSLHSSITLNVSPTGDGDNNMYHKLNKCMRIESALGHEIVDNVSRLSRQCCDVLGPTACHQCSRVERRGEDAERCQSAFPNLHISEDNFMTSVMVQKCLPSLSYYEIQQLLAKGEISKNNLKENLVKNRLFKRSTNGSQYDKRRSSSISKCGANVMFFSSIQDLNYKIITGLVDKHIISKPGNNLKQGHGKDSTSFVSSVESYSRRQSKQSSVKPFKPSYISFYEPPILPRVSQVAVPTFFAGRKSSYTLPKRLPEKIVFHEQPHPSSTTKVDSSKQS